MNIKERLEAADKLPHRVLSRALLITGLGGIAYAAASESASSIVLGSTVLVGSFIGYVGLSRFDVDAWDTESSPADAAPTMVNPPGQID